MEKSPITFEVNEGKGTLRIGDVADCEMEDFPRSQRRGHDPSRFHILDDPGRTRIRGKGDEV